MKSAHATVENNGSINHIWERFNFKWIIAGVVSALLSGFIILGLTCLLAANVLGEAIQPLKILGAAILGNNGSIALAYGPLNQYAVAGILIHGALCAWFGATFAQMVDENSKALSLVILGFVTSLVIWVFGGSLFSGSFNITLWSVVDRWLWFGLHIAFGVLFGIILSVVRGALGIKSR